MACHGDAHGCQHVVEQTVRGEGREEGPSNGVQRARGSDHGIHLAFGLPDPLFVGPVEAGPLFAGQMQGAADRTHSLVGKGRDERTKGRGIDPLARVAEHDDLTAGSRYAPVECGGLACGPLHALEDQRCRWRCPARSRRWHRWTRR